MKLLVEKISMIILIVVIAIALYGNFVVRHIKVVEVNGPKVTIRIGQNYYEISE